MSSEKSIIDKLKSAFSVSPLELHWAIVFTECRVFLARASNNCSRLDDDEDLKQTPSKRQEIIESIISDIGEVKHILWAAVEASRSGNYKKNSNPEG